MKLAGRCVLITGAASGIGRATAELFFKEGALLALLDVNTAQLDIVASGLDDGGGRIVAVAVDLAHADQVEEAVARSVAALGGLDTLVNAAGVDLAKPFGETSTEDWRLVMDINLIGPVLVCGAALPALRAAGSGVIINIASGAGLRPLEQRVAYCTSKAALIMLTRSLALELASDGIRANVICPGAIDTPLLHASLVNTEALDAVKSRYALRRIGTPEDIAFAALYLAGSQAGFITGTTLTVDGGRAFH